MIVIDENNTELLYNYVASKTSIPFDVESSGLDPYRDLTLCWMTGEINNEFFVPANLDINPSLFNDKELVGHNIKFDYVMSVIHPQKVRNQLFEFTGTTYFDTQLANQIIFNGLDYQHNLAAIADEWLGIYMPKDVRQTFIGQTHYQFSEGQIKYGVGDIRFLPKIKNLQIKRIIQDELELICNLECELLPILGSMELEGCKINKTRLLELEIEFKQELKRCIRELDAELVKLSFTHYPELAHTKFTRNRADIEAAPQIPLFDFGNRTKKELNRVKSMVKSVNKPNINYNSTVVLPELFDLLDLDKPTDFKTGRTSFGKDAINEYLTENSESPFYNFLTKLLEMREFEGYITKYGKNSEFIKSIFRDFIHTTYSQCFTDTGRLCIEENQLVTTVGGLKKIKDIEVGELVYCYDTEGKLRIRKVLNVFNKGEKEIVKLQWKSSGDSTVGELLCTANHRIKSKHRGWIMAKALNTGEPLFHLSRRDHIENGSNRPRLYGTNLTEKEQATIKREYFKCTDFKIHLHHIDEDTANNKVTNLELKTNIEHAREHGIKRHKEGKLKYEHLWLPENRGIPKRGSEHPGYITVTKYQLLKEILQTGGRPTYANISFNVFKNKCQEHGINLNEVAKRFNREGTYISRGSIKKTSNEPTHRLHKQLKLGFYRVNELRDYYGIINHRVQAVIPFGKAIIYDLEVEEYNNFIASEICVHNSSSNVNLQNIPKKGSGYKLREAFVAEEGWSFITCDMAGQEARIAGELSGEPLLIDAFTKGLDIHRELASPAYSLIFKKEVIIDSGTEPFRVPCIWQKELNKSIAWVNAMGEETVEVYNYVPNDLREISKNALYGTFYGAGGDRLYAIYSKFINQHYQGGDRKEVAKRISRLYKSKLPTLMKYLEGRVRLVKNDGFITGSKLGRRRYWANPEKGHGDIMNFPIQNTGAESMKLAIINVHKWCVRTARDDLGIDYREFAYPIMNIHDRFCCV